MTEEELEAMKKAMDNLKPSDLLDWSLGFVPVQSSMDDQHFALLDLIAHAQPFPKENRSEWNKVKQALVKTGYLEWVPSLQTGRDAIVLTIPGRRAYEAERDRRERSRAGSLI